MDQAQKWQSHLVQVQVFVDDWSVHTKPSNSSFLLLDVYGLRLLTYRHLQRVAKSFPCVVYGKYTEVHGGGINRHGSNRAHTAYLTPTLMCLCVCAVSLMQWVLFLILSQPLVRLRYWASLVVAPLNNDVLVPMKMGFYTALLYVVIFPPSKINYFTYYLPTLTDVENSAGIIWKATILFSLGFLNLKIKKN